MSAPTVPPPSAELPPRPRPAPATVAEAPKGASVRDLASNLVAGTPGRLRLYGAIGIVACLAFGFVAFVATQRLHADISHARDDAAQLVRVQTIRTSIVKADANATNAFLVGGLEPAGVRAQYDDGIVTAARTLAEATGAKSADEATLASVNRTLATYAGLIESARANNRQGFPIGAAYLRQATDLVQQEALPKLERLVLVEQARVDDSTGAADSAPQVLGALLLVVLFVLVVVQFFLYGRSRRVFNLAVVVGTVVVLLAGVAGLGVMAWSRAATSDVRDHAYRRTVALATARIDGFDAKSAEALTLINRGSGQPYEDRFKAVSAAATRAMAADLPSLSEGSPAPTVSAFNRYLAAHTDVRKLDDAGNWDGAVAAATGTGAANQTFAAFEQVSARALQDEASGLSDDLDTARLPLTALSWLLLAAGLVAAVATWRGVNQRLREYR